MEVLKRETRRIESDIVILPELIRTLCHLAKDDRVKFLLVTDTFWLTHLKKWLASDNRRILLFTAYLVSILFEQDEIGIRVIKEIGLERLASVDMIDVDVRHIIEHIFKKFQEKEAIDSNAPIREAVVLVNEHMELVTKE